MKKYHMPTVGTILPAQPNEDFDNPGQLASLEKRTQWLQADAQDRADIQNSLITADWKADGGGWGRWLNEYESGRMMGPKGQGDPDAPTPIPPAGKVVEVKAAENGGIFFDIVDGTEPVCDIPKYTKITAPQHYKK